MTDMTDDTTRETARETAQQRAERLQSLQRRVHESIGGPQSTEESLAATRRVVKGE